MNYLFSDSFITWHAIWTRVCKKNTSADIYCFATPFFAKRNKINLFLHLYCFLYYHMSVCVCVWDRERSVCVRVCDRERVYVLVSVCAKNCGANWKWAIFEKSQPTFRSQFQQYFTSSFYAHRSQMRKKDL